MATLVFSTVGTILGGPVGGAIGALLGQSIDQELLAPRGPKVGDLKVQSSDYGTPIPRVYGTMRVAGSVVWATDLEASGETSGAKGQTGTSTSYRVSFAVALSSRAGSRIGRIWADGKLLRGAEGDFKVSTIFRFYPGTESQSADPLIGSLEGAAATPAYRGLVLAVFEHLELAEYGNRIPFLTFELIADETPPSLAAVLGDATGGAVDCSSGQAVRGYAAYGASIRAAIAPLVEAYALDLFDDGERVRAAADREALVIADDELGQSADGKPAPRIERALAPLRALPAALRLTYYDPQRDYQAGEARASAGEQGGSEERRELAAAIESSEAKALVHAMLARQWAARDSLTLRLPTRLAGLEPGARLILPFVPDAWIVEAVTIERYVAIAELRPYWQPALSLPADAGRLLGGTDVVAAPVTLALVELPGGGSDENGGGPSLLVAASSATTYRAMPVTITAGARDFALTSAASKAMLGISELALGDGQSWLRDDRNSLTVALVDPDQWIESRSADALAAGENLAMVGDEAIQFAVADPLGGGRFRLSGLLRGRLGTEWAIGGHGPGEAFVMLDPRQLARIDLPAGTTGTDAIARGRSAAGDCESARISVRGERLKPLRPVHLTATREPNGDLAIAWVRRSRAGFDWLDEVEVPLGQSAERYRLHIAGSGSAISLECVAPLYVVPAAEIAALGPGLATISVRQVGDRAVSRPATLSLNLVQEPIQ